MQGLLSMNSFFYKVSYILDNKNSLYFGQGKLKDLNVKSKNSCHSSIHSEEEVDMLAAFNLNSLN